LVLADDIRTAGDRRGRLAVRRHPARGGSRRCARLRPREACVGGVRAYERATGSQVGELCALTRARVGCLPGDGIWSTPAIDATGRGFIGVGNPDDGVLAFEVATGKGLWLTRLRPDSGRDVDVGATPIVFQSGGR